MAIEKIIAHLYNFSERHPDVSIRELYELAVMAGCDLTRSQFDEAFSSQ